MPGAHQQTTTQKISCCSGSHIAAAAAVSAAVVADIAAAVATASPSFSSANCKASPGPPTRGGAGVSVAADTEEQKKQWGLAKHKTLAKIMFLKA